MEANAGVAAGLISADCLEVVMLPGKGRALRATRNLAEGDEIMLKGFVWYIESESSKNTDINYVAEYKLFMERHRGQEDQASLVSSLQSHHTSTDVTDNYQLQKMFEINGFRKREGTAVSVPLGSFANHSCSPNFSLRIRLRKDRVFLTALQDVVAGAEVTVSYLPDRVLTQEVQHRQARLVPWGFYCECEKCQADADALALLANPEGGKATEALLELWEVREAAVGWSGREALEGPCGSAQEEADKARMRTYSIVRHFKDEMNARLELASEAEERKRHEQQIIAARHSALAFEVEQYAGVYPGRNKSWLRQEQHARGEEKCACKSGYIFRQCHGKAYH